MVTANLFNVDRKLFEQICAEDNLVSAFRSVKRNKGAAGIDKVTVEMFDARLHEEVGILAKELREWRYKPQPVRRVEILKSDGKSIRELGIPTVRDRIVQTCIKEVLEPLYEPEFSNHSYGFRPKRNQKQAVLAAREQVVGGKKWIVDIDLAKFFDTIPHDRLIHRLAHRVTDNRVLKLIALMLRSGVMCKGGFQDTHEGSVQGSPLSPLLSNIALDELDKELERRKLSFCRFADDCNIFVRTKIAAERVMNSITRFIETHLKLKVNREKSKVATSSDVSFLGFTITGKAIMISKKSMKRAMIKITALTRTHGSAPVQKTLAKINQWYVGWGEYFSTAQFPFQFEVLESHVRRRLRARLIRQCKRRRNLCRRFIRSGVNKRMAANQAYSNTGPWKLSNQRSATITWSNKWFLGVGGQKLISTRALPHWFSVKRRIFVR